MSYRPHRRAGALPRPAATRREQNSEKIMTLLKGLGVIACIAAFIALVVFGIRAHAARTRDCKAHGGHVTHTTSTHYYSDSHGTHSSSDTTYYCVTADRGIIDVWG